MLCSVSLFLMNIFSWLAAFIQIPSVIFDLDAKCGGFPSYEIVFTHNSYSNFVIHRVWGRKNVHQWIGIIYIPGMDLPFGVWNICTCIKSWNISNLPTKGIFRIYWDQITWWKTQVYSQWFSMKHCIHCIWNVLARNLLSFHGISCATL